MKYTALILIALSSSLSATFTLNTTFGTARNAAGIAVPDGTLWALVVDSDNNNVFAGFGIDESLYAENQISAGIADSFFTSAQSISLGSVVGGGTVFSMGGFNGGDGSTNDSLAELNLGTNGMATGLEFAFYWFPGATFTGDANDPQTISNEVGGIQNSTTDIGFFEAGMLIPSDSNTVYVGAGSESLGGSLANTSFQAVTLVPEPSTALLGAFGALALLRRRRVVQD